MSRPQRYYDDKLAADIASEIPEGIAQGNLLVKDSTSMIKATNSKKFVKFVFVGNQSVGSDEPRGRLPSHANHLFIWLTCQVIFPRLVSRKSTKQLKQQVMEGWT